MLELFNKHHVEYIIVGGYALAFHGVPRYTGDIDLFVGPSKTSAQKILDSLDEFGFGSLGVTLNDLTQPNQIIQLGLTAVTMIGTTFRSLSSENNPSFKTNALPDVSKT